MTGLVIGDGIDLADFGLGTTTITKITGGGAAGSITNVTLTDSSNASHVETPHLINTTANEFGTTIVATIS